MAVSLWLTHAGELGGGESELYVAVVEPVQRVVSNLLLDEYGTILSADDVALSLFHTNDKDFQGHNIIKWIPNIRWPIIGNLLDDVISFSLQSSSSLCCLIDCL